MDDYYRRMRAQQSHWASMNRRHLDDYYYAPATYRYRRDGRYYNINDYAANVLRQAVNHGYDEGYRVGLADRMDGWRPDYRNSYAYQDANYGYGGYHVDQGEYSHYFRQGFSRGYEDGYYSRNQYGRRDDDGNYLILAAVVAAVLGFENLF